MVYIPVLQRNQPLQHQVGPLKVRTWARLWMELSLLSTGEKCGGDGGFKRSLAEVEIKVITEKRHEDMLKKFPR